MKFKTKTMKNKKKIVFKFLFFLIIALLIFPFLSLYKYKQVEFYAKKIEKMKNYEEILSNTQNNELKTYYVSADGTSKDGTNINNPMSLAEANKKTYYGNERVLFKSNDIFYGQINFNVKANKDEMFYIGSYGEGSNPVISGASILTNRDAWNLDTDGIYKIDLSNHSYFEGIDKSNLEHYNIGFISDEAGNIYGNRKRTKKELKEQNDFFCEDKYLYIKSDKNPSDKFGYIKFVSRNDLVKVSSYTIIEDLNIQYTGAHAISKRNDNVENVYINKCIIQNIGGSVQVADTFTRYGNGIEFWNQGENIIVENCIIRNIYDAGFTIQGTSLTTGYKNIVARDNIFINCTYPIEISARNASAGDDAIKNGISLCYIENNISINQGSGWGYYVRPDKNPSAELVVWSLPTNKTELEIKNNKYFNPLRLKYIADKSLNEYIKSIYSHDNIILLNSKSYLVNNSGNYQDDSILEKYNQEVNSKLEILSDDEITKISNPKILKSNNYDLIKSYYETVENEVKLDQPPKDNLDTISQNVLKKYSEFESEFKTEITSVNGLQNTIDSLKQYMTNIASLQVENENTAKQKMDQHFSIGKQILEAYKNGSLKVDYTKLSLMLDMINDIGYSYGDLVTISSTTANSNLQTTEALINSVNQIINNNSDLNLVYPKKYLKISKELYSKANYINSLTEKALFKIGLMESSSLHAKYLANWATTFANIYVDDYIKNNPISESYSETNWTNKDVTVTLNIGNDTKITNNSGKNTYIFTNNGTFTFQYERRGRKLSKEVKVNNIDKKLPVISGVENNKTYYNAVTPKVTDEHLKEVQLKKDGQVIDGYKSGNEIKDAGKYELIGKDIAGNETKIEFEILYKFTFDSKIYSLKDKNIIGIKHNTKLIDFNKELKTNEKYKVSRNYKELKDNDIIATGDILEIENGQKYYLIVQGDINKDGNTNITDLVKIRRKILSMEEFDEYQTMAADLAIDNKINITDLVRIRRIILGYGL